VAGTVDEEEDYKTNILKEAEEEIGLKGIKPRIGPKERVSGEYNFFGQWYLLEINKPLSEFTIDQSEVEEIKWFSKKELLKEIRDNPAEFLETMKRCVRLFCK
jgi:8-oxo-dGTP pyrophosphatase MutT (NUDIX family)